MHATAVRTMIATDQAAAINTIVLAVATDPVARWVWPDAQRYAATIGPFTRAFGGGAFHHKSAYAATTMPASPCGCRPERTPTKMRLRS